MSSLTLRIMSYYPVQSVCAGWFKESIFRSYKTGTWESVSSPFPEAVLPWRYFSPVHILLQLHLHFLVLLAEVVIQGVSIQVVNSPSCVVCWAKTAVTEEYCQREGWVYFSPPPFPVSNQIRLVRQTSNGKKKKCIKIFTRLQ